MYTHFPHKYPVVDGEWTSEMKSLTVNCAQIIYLSSVLVIQLSKTARCLCKKIINFTALSLIYAEQIEFGDKHGENVITRLKKTHQTGHMLDNEIFAGVFPLVAEDNIEYSIESYLTLKIFGQEQIWLNIIINFV